MRALVESDSCMDMIGRRDDFIHRLRLVGEVALVHTEKVCEIGGQAKLGEGFQVGTTEWDGEEGAPAVRFMEHGHAFAQGQFERPLKQPPVLVEGENVAACVANDGNGFMGECMEIVLLE